MVDTNINCEELIDEYVDGRKWRVKENANVRHSFQGLILHTAGTVQAKYCLSKLPEHISDAHLKGFIHIHDLSLGLTSYCSGWSLSDLLLEGFNNDYYSSSKPPKHFRTALSQMVNFLGTLQNANAGAQAFNNVDTLLAPFIYYDKLSYEDVKQSVQSFVFSMNVSSRWGMQCPFTNVSLDIICPDFLRNEPVIIGGKPQEETYGEFQDQIDIFNNAFLDILAEGDGNGRIFSFPIPTYSVTRDFPWKSEFGRKLLDVTAKYGIPYFSNFINSEFNPEDVRSMCCRLRLSKKEVLKKMGGIFGSADKTGSIGVVTLNLPRMAYLSESKEQFLDMVGTYCEIASEYLEIKRKSISKFLNKGLLPWTKRYLQKGFNAHFSTIGLVGGHEACLNLLGSEYGIDSKEGKQLMLDTLDFMVNKANELQIKTGSLMNVESSPAESCTYRFIRLDKKEFPDIIQSGDNVKYYTNSTALPVNKKIDVIEAVKHQSDLQVKYTGGTVFHSFLGENITNLDTLENYIKKVFTNTKIPYLTITPTFSICCDHGYISGEHFKCPECGRKTEVYSRVVGYYRDISSWNDSKQEEYSDRETFTL